MEKRLVNVQAITHIHTIEILDRESDINMLKDVVGVNSTRNSTYKHIKHIFNPSKYLRFLISDINTFKNTVNFMVNDSNIQSCKLNRVDVTTDLDINLKENLGLLDLVYRCLCRSEQNDDNTYRDNEYIDRDTKEKLGFLFRKNKSLEIAIYDKIKQSDGKEHLTPFDKITRIEIRFKQTKSKNGVDYYLNQVIKKFKIAHENFSIVEDDIIKLLKKLLKETRDKTHGINLCNFICMYNDLFLTKRILKEIYLLFDYSETAFNQWISSNKSNIPIVLYKKNDVEKINKKIIASLKLYSKN